MLWKSLLLLCLGCFAPLLGHAQNDAYAMHRVLQRYTESYGGFRDADSLASLSVEGTIEQGGETSEFLMRKKRPWSLRYRLTKGRNNVVTGFNGSSGWLRLETDGKVSIKDLDGDALDALREQARFESPLFRHSEKRENELSLLERNTFEGESVYVIEVRELGRRISHYYLEAKNAHVLRRDQLDEEGEIIFQTLYREYREVEGFPFAHEVENRIGGETVALIRVNSVEVNPGLLSFYFEKPER